MYRADSYALFTLSRRSSSLRARSTYGLTVPVASTTFSRVLAMLGSSFRSLPSAVLPRPGRGKQLALPLLAAAFLGGCGGTSGGKEETSLRRVQGAGYSFRAPADWRTSRRL